MIEINKKIKVDMTSLLVQLQITDFTEEVSKEMQSLKQKLLMIPQKNFLFLTGVKMVKNSINHPQMLQV